MPDLRPINRTTAGSIEIDYSLGTRPRPAGACGPVFDRRLAASSPKLSTATVQASSPVLDPAPDQVVVVDAGLLTSPTSYVVARVGSDVSHVAVAAGPATIADEMQPVSGWVALVVPGQLDAVALEVTRTSTDTAIDAVVTAVAVPSLWGR